jgi:hypothetical protein
VGNHALAHEHVLEIALRKKLVRVVVPGVLGAEPAPEIMRIHDLAKLEAGLFELRRLVADEGVQPFYGNAGGAGVAELIIITDPRKKTAVVKDAYPGKISSHVCTLYS